MSAIWKKIKALACGDGKEKDRSRIETEEIWRNNGTTLCAKACDEEAKEDSKYNAEKVAYERDMEEDVVDCRLTRKYSCMLRARYLHSVRT